MIQQLQAHPANDFDFKVPLCCEFNSNDKTWQEESSKRQTSRRQRRNNHNQQLILADTTRQKFQHGPFLTSGPTSSSHVIRVLVFHFCFLLFTTSFSFVNLEQLRNYYDLVRSYRSVYLATVCIKCANMSVQSWDHSDTTEHGNKYGLVCPRCHEEYSWSLRDREDVIRCPTQVGTH